MWSCCVRWGADSRLLLAASQLLLVWVGVGVSGWAGVGGKRTGRVEKEVGMGMGGGGRWVIGRQEVCAKGGSQRVMRRRCILRWAKATDICAGPYVRNKLLCDCANQEAAAPG